MEIWRETQRRIGKDERQAASGVKTRQKKRVSDSSTVRYRVFASRSKHVSETSRIASAQKDRPCTHQWIKAIRKLIANHALRILWIFA